MTKRLEKLIKALVTMIAVTVILLFCANHDMMIDPIYEILKEGFSNIGVDRYTAADASGIIITYSIIMLTRAMMKLIFRVRLKISLKKKEAEVSE